MPFNIIIIIIILIEASELVLTKNLLLKHCYRRQGCVPILHYRYCCRFFLYYQYHFGYHKNPGT